MLFQIEMLQDRSPKNQRKRRKSRIVRSIQEQGSTNQTGRSTDGGVRPVDPCKGIFTMNQIKHIYELSELNQQGKSNWNAGKVSLDLQGNYRPSGP